MDPSRARPRLYLLGLYGPAPYDHRGLRRPVRQEICHPRHRALGLCRLRGGFLRLCRARGPWRLLGHKAPRLTQAQRPCLALLRLSHDSCLGDTGDDALVVITLLLYRAAQTNTGDFPYGWWAFASHGIGRPAPARGWHEQDAQDLLCRHEHRRDHVVSRACRLLQAPSHLHGTL